jgi:saposin
VECSICKYVVGYVDAVIQKNKSEAAVEAALEKVCTILPHALNASCVQFVEKYGPALVHLLENYTTPEQVCAALKLCHNGTLESIPCK